MENFKSLSRYDIEQGLTPDQVKITQIICIALFTGTVIFLILILILNSDKQVAENPGEISDIGRQYIYGVVLFALMAYSFIYFFPGIFLTKTAITKKIASAGIIKDNSEAVLFLIGMDRQFRIIQLAIFEGIALFAMVGIFLELTNSNYQLSGNIWFLTLPVAIFAFYLFANFPTKENIINRIEKDILAHIK